MKILRTPHLLVAAGILRCASFAGAEERVAVVRWETDFVAAKQKAERDVKDLFLNFTGSDWCGFCIVLHDQVLTDSAFEQGVVDNFVLVELDYPRHKEQSDQLREQNEKLRGDFAVKGFPNLILADSEGRAYAEIPSQPGIEPEQLVSQIQSFRGLREKRDELMKAARSLEGMKRAEKLDEALNLLDDALVERFYSDSLDEIVALDEKDSLKRKKGRGIAKALHELEQRVHVLAQQQDHEGISAAVDALVVDKKLKGEDQQRALMMKLGLFGSDKLGDAAEFLKKVEKVKSDSKIGREAAAMRRRVQQYQKEQSESAEPEES